MAVIGTGDIGTVLVALDRPDVTYFASGVSNSQCTDIKEYTREAALLGSMPKDRHLIYFSSLSIYLTESMYVMHKRQMERLIKENFDTYTIIRIGNITWGINPNTFINYLRSHPEAEIKPVWRHIVDKEDFLYWVGLALVGERCEMNITGRRVWLPEYVKTIRT